ncbi:MAG: ArsA family ATPase, partial [Thermoleophilaceae bacterium]|nr:ArsA family ATPase [Thermoleophilaceae bacterium]
MSAGDLLAGKRVCICAGPGGVGKTTVAAALATGLAADGSRVAVVTIDPARRLADALGLAALDDEPRRVEPERLAAAGLRVEGELWALTLDAKRTWDHVVARYAPDARTRATILSNPVYQQLSSAVAGTQEYMAMEKLYELHEQGGYDVVVLDTPPTRNALDFLDAPGRLLRFVDSRSLRLLTRPGRLGLRVAGRGAGAAFAVLERVSGVELLREVSEFLRAFDSMADDFRARAARVKELLGDPATAFVAVTSPRPESVGETIFLAGRLRGSGMRLAGAVVNRVHDGPPLGPGDHAELVRLVGPELAQKVASGAHDARALAERDRGGL